MTKALTVDVFNSGYKPIPSAVPGWDPDRQATWPATTSTLIAGERGAILVDSFDDRGRGRAAGRMGREVG
jgi:hypothetical protein